eukprot:jgi/Botrbrau1/20004/Bobra.200_1s0011.1
MVKITESLIRKRAEHNEGILRTLEEVSLHQQNIEKIELLGQACRKLKILYLQNNLIGKIENLHRLKDLEYLNLALNNITKVQNLQRCESLKKLDLTVNFIDKAGLLTIGSLDANAHLEELFLLGNPCAQWPGYRQLVVAALPKLKKLDGQAITPSERIRALQVHAELQAQLRTELLAEGVDLEQASAVEDDSFADCDAIPETGYVDEHGEVRRPWCPATRWLEHKENERRNGEADSKKAAATPGLAPDTGQHPKNWDDFPPIEDMERPMQRNEGKWPFTLKENDDDTAAVLEVDVGKYLDTSLIKADVQPTVVRLLIKGKLLQLRLPGESNWSLDLETSASKQAGVRLDRGTVARPPTLGLRGAREAEGRTQSGRPLQGPPANTGRLTTPSSKAVVQSCAAQTTSCAAQDASLLEDLVPPL